MNTYASVEAWLHAFLASDLNVYDSSNSGLDRTKDDEKTLAVTEWETGRVSEPFCKPWSKRKNTF
jgi:hypothetical protein